MATPSSLANTTWTGTIQGANGNTYQFVLAFGSGPTNSTPGTGSITNPNDASNGSNGITNPFEWGETEGNTGARLFVVSVSQWSPANGWWIGTAVPGTGAGQGTGSGYCLWNPSTQTQHMLINFTMEQTS